MLHITSFVSFTTCYTPLFWSPSSHTVPTFSTFQLMMYFLLWSPLPRAVPNTSHPLYPMLHPLFYSHLSYLTLFLNLPNVVMCITTIIYWSPDFFSLSLTCCLTLNSLISPHSEHHFHPSSSTYLPEPLFLCVISIFFISYLMPHPSFCYYSPYLLLYTISLNPISYSHLRLYPTILLFLHSCCTSLLIFKIVVLTSLLMCTTNPKSSPHYTPICNFIYKTLLYRILSIFFSSALS